MSVEAQNVIIGVLIAFILPMLATIPVVALLCRYRLAGKKRISYGSVFIGAFVIPLLLAIVMTCSQPDIWWSHEHKSSPEAFLGFLFYVALMCILPSFVVVRHYRRRNERDETRVS